MKKSIKTNSKNSSSFDKYLDKKFMSKPGLSMREMMKDDGMRDIMMRMIKAGIDSVKK
ncbi:hypothetical protein GW940_00070 [Candidatus Microgenomates bacterium]|nr:hypothetical protein [Candidatus Microgenomates bacterium]